MWKFLGYFWSARISLGTDLAICIIIYALNCMLVSMRPGIAMEFGSTKRNRCRRSGLPVDSPHALFWDCKNSSSLYEMDHKCPCVFARESFDENGLVCVEIDRLRHDFNVLTQ